MKIIQKIKKNNVLIVQFNQYGVAESKTIIDLKFRMHIGANFNEKAILFISLTQHQDKISLDNSSTPTSNDISIYTNVGRTDGNTSSGDIRECIARVID